MNLQQWNLGMTRPTSNEINNLIYMFIRYSFEFNDPNNKDIHEIMLRLEGNLAKQHIINKTIEYMKEKYGEGQIGTDTYHLRRHMEFVYDEFFQLPFSLRDDLGDDKEADEFITKH